MKPTPCFIGALPERQKIAVNQQIKSGSTFYAG
jgi:hypothetical protein